MTKFKSTKSCEPKTSYLIHRLEVIQKNAKANTQVRKPGDYGKVASMLLLSFLLNHSNGLSSKLYQFSKTTPYYSMSVGSVCVCV